MIGKELVTSLDEGWRDALDAIARARRWPVSGDVARLGAEVAKLSRAYNDPQVRAHAPGDAGGLAARLGFSFVRDVPKGAAAARELIATGRLVVPEGRALRLLDVGAGLGATTWGLARALAAGGHRGEIDATWIDGDGATIDLAAAILEARGGKNGARVDDAGALKLRVRSVPRDVGRGLPPLDRFDVVLLGQVLSELDLALDDDARVAKHAALLRQLVLTLEPDGALVVVEPALRDRTRHLHRVRDAVLAGPDAPTLFAPCLHAAPCPALASEGDWCHEDLDVDLPPWLVPVARAAGLRYQGLTFSYLVLRRDAHTLVGSLAPARGARLRVVSDAFVTKGKREQLVCGELADGAALVPGRARLMRLDRHHAAANEAFDHLVRGDVFTVEPSPARDRARVSEDAVVTLADPLAR